MTQSQLNNQFTLLYNDLKTYADKAKWHLSTQHIDTSAILAECYLHLNKCIQDLHTPQDVEAFAKKWIKQNLSWQSSPIKRQYQTNHFEEIPDVSTQEYTNFEIYEQAVNSFLQTLSSHDRRLWSIYHEKGKTSGKLVAEHLEMSLSTGYEILRQCKEVNRRFRQYLLTQVI